MRKLSSIVLLCSLLLLPGCKHEEIVFPIEQPQFETKAGKILIEIIAPTETAISKDVICIQGPFSGGQPLELERAEYMDYKYGIYLDPATFAKGKTLADGYWFTSSLSGREMSDQKTEVKHYETAAAGERIDLTLTHWEMFFNAHNGHVLYVEDQSSWSTLYLYAWADGEPEIFGGWPGTPATGTEEIDGVEYTYFDLMSDNTGKTYNFILNDGGAGQQKDAVSQFEITRDIYLVLTDDACKEKGASVGHRLYALNHTGWLSMSLYVWGDGEFMGGWPGSKPLKTQIEVAGNKYDVFEFPANANDKKINLIFNNGTDKTKPESIQLTLDKDYYIQVVVDGGPKEIDPYGDIIKPDLPEGNMVIHATQPASWPNLFIFSSGYTNDWPGSLMDKEKDSNYFSFELPRGATFVFSSAPIGNQTAEIKNITDDAWFELNDDGTYKQVK